MKKEQSKRGEKKHMKQKRVETETENAERKRWKETQNDSSASEQDFRYWSIM